MKWTVRRENDQGSVWLTNEEGEDALFTPDTPGCNESERAFVAYRIATDLGIQHVKTEILEIKCSELYGVPEDDGVLTGTLSYNNKTDPNVSYVPIHKLNE